MTPSPPNMLLYVLVLLLTAATGIFLFSWVRVRSTLKVQLQRFRQQLQELDQTILQAKKHLEATFDSIADGIAVLDTDYNIIRLNRTYADFSNRAISSLLNRKCHESLRDLESPCPECPITNKKYHDGFSCRIGNNKYQIEVKPARMSGIVQNYIETVRDVTRFESLHSQLRRSERMATIGTMVAGIAHEMNNPLSGISGNSQLILRTPEKYGLNEKGLARITTIAESSRRATQIVSELLSFSTPPQIHFQQILLKTIFESGLTKIDGPEYKGIEVRFDFPPREEIHIWGDPDQLASLMSKIILNSFQAISEARKTDSGLKGSVTLSGSLRGEDVIATITDNGCGIPEENRNIIFDPFFTTHEPGSGIGMGLSICHRIMSEHFGSIKLTRLEKGTQVQMVFPFEKQEIY